MGYSINIQLWRLLKQRQRRFVFVETGCFVSCLVAAMHLRPIILTKTVTCNVQLRTAAKHIVYALLVAMHFLEIEGCELADLYQNT